MKKIIILSSIIITAITFNACSDFLDVSPVGAVAETNLLDKEGIEMVVTGMYSKLYQDREWYFEATLSNYAFGDVMGGSANKGSSFADQPDFTNLELYTITTENLYTTRKWRGAYNGVFSANVVIDMASKIEGELKFKGMEKDYYTETVAQACFFRAFWHFEVIKLFGAAVPYVGTEEYLSDVNPKVSNVDEGGNYIYIWDKVIEDLQFAYDNLPKTWGSDRGKVNKWAAGALLAKVMMYQSSPYNGTNNTVNRWNEVKTLLEEIMNSGTDSNGTKYKLADSYEQLYTAGESDWTGESIFDIQMAISGQQTLTNAINGGPHIGMSGALGTNGWGFYQPSYDLVNSHIVDDNGLPLIDKSYQQKEPLTVAVEGTPKTALDVYTDPRLDYSTGRFQIPYWDWSVPLEIDGWVREASNGGYYLNKKNIPKKADQGSLSVGTSSASTAKNFHLIRYADLLLWYAEALIETGNHQAAREYVNKIRARAANSYVEAVDPETMEPSASSYVLDDKINNKKAENAAANYRIGLYPESQFATKEKAMEALRFERKIELAMEGHRWFDLARWGIAHEELNNYINYEKNYLVKFRNSIYNEKWVTLPIPHAEIITMDGLLVQNVNWK